MLCNWLNWHQVMRLRIKFLALSLVTFSLVTSVIFLAATPTWAIPIQDIPNPRRLNGTWVSDVAQILRPTTKQQINQRINQLEARQGAEMAVVTVPDTQPARSAKEYATNLFNTWGIGKRGLDNGILLLISVNERRIEIETGRGLREQLTDHQVAQIIATQIKPEFKHQNFDQGTINGVAAIASHLEQVHLSDFDWTPAYSFMAGLGIVAVLSGVVWTALKINSWCSLLPDRFVHRSPDHINANINANTGLVFQIKVSPLNQVAQVPLLMIAAGNSVVTTSASAFLIAKSVSINLPSHYYASLWIRMDYHFIDLLSINVLCAIITMPLWCGLTSYWLIKLAKSTKETISEQSYSIQLWQRWGIELIKNFLLLLIIQAGLLMLAALLMSPSFAPLLPSYVLFGLVGLIIALGNQLFLNHVSNQVYLDHESKKNIQEQFFCTTCLNPIQAMAETSHHLYLQQPEQLAMSLGNATYKLYTCGRCYPNPKRQNIHCEPHILKSETVCPKCQYATVVDKSLKQSRKSKKFPKQNGKDAISIRQCQNCFYEQPVYPYVPPTYHTYSHTYSADSDYSSSSSGSSYTDSYTDYSSGSSSDFGGGSSDGGGSGSDW